MAMTYSRIKNFHE